MSKNPTQADFTVYIDGDKLGAEFKAFPRTDEEISAVADAVRAQVRAHLVNVSNRNRAASVLIMVKITKEA
jgi:hypothetical protein